MLPYKNVYSLQDGKLVKNKENKIEYIDENGKKRVKTNPSYKDFAKVGKYPLKESETQDDDLTIADEDLFYVIENGRIITQSKEETEK